MRNSNEDNNESDNRNGCDNSTSKSGDDHAVIVRVQGITAFACGLVLARALEAILLKDYH